MAAVGLNLPWSSLASQPVCPKVRKTVLRIHMSLIGSLSNKEQKPVWHVCTAFANAIDPVTSESVSVSLKRAKSCPFWAYLAPTEMPVSIKLVTSWRFTLMLNLWGQAWTFGYALAVLQPGLTTIKILPCYSLVKDVNQYSLFNYQSISTSHQCWFKCHIRSLGNRPQQIPATHQLHSHIIFVLTHY